MIIRYSPSFWKCQLSLYTGVVENLVLEGSSAATFQIICTLVFTPVFFNGAVMLHVSRTTNNGFIADIFVVHLKEEKCAQ